MQNTVDWKQPKSNQIKNNFYLRKRTIILFNIAESVPRTRLSFTIRDLNRAEAEYMGITFLVEEGPEMSIAAEHLPLPRR
jgi:6-phosphogluconolactonase/glucosamine-6-phosphate isomerase/deaminase